MVTQLLFGELFRIVGREENWRRIQLLYDDYEGWTHEAQITPLVQEEFIRLEQAVTPVSTDLVQLVIRENQEDMIPIVPGSSLPGLDNGTLIIAGEKFFYEGDVSRDDLISMPPGSQKDVIIREQIRENALLYLNAPYQWGGRSPFGLDCSGFTQMVFKLVHIQLLRDATQQSTQGEGISFLNEAMAGDLAFFDNEEGYITHVGILLDNSAIIHCSGKVKVDMLDHEGIYDHTQKKYTHKLRLIKRII
jgi:hypothetical protein